MAADPGVIAAFLGGLLSFLSPCVLPLVPSYLGFVTGMSAGEMTEATGRERGVVLAHALLFVVGFSAVFVAMGASASALGQLLRAYRPWLTRVGGVVVLLFGLHLLGLTPLRWLDRERRVHLERKPLGYPGSLAVGVAFGAGWVPCIGPILGSILTLGATRSGVWEGVGLLGVYSAGLAVPFLASALALSRFFDAYRRFRPWLRWFGRAGGVLLLAVSVLLLSGQFTVLAGWAARLTPDFLLQRL